ncbi:TfuA-like protein [Roseobacter sp. S98]|uniref:TfuA-like protein n=1 Tax=Roseobacter algicola (ex Choi et al. 2025) (nom. illeg.) TaxID=3092138 RepID=UPI0035C6D774
MIVFAGPSLAPSERDAWPGVTFLPPVRQGDLYLATLDRPRAIGVIDGYFEGVPSVWHKEILWALSRSIPVLGASSMGALRAAELDSFGMQGVGRIYEAYRDLEYTDDDEVALLHGPAELGYPLLSLAMVNLRATLRAAADDGILGHDLAAQIVCAAKRQHYKQRTWETVLQAAGSEVSAAEVSALRDYIQNNEVDQKRADARALLDAMTSDAIARPPQNFHFEETDLWVQATQTWSTRRAPASGTGYNLFKDKSFLGG